MNVLMAALLTLRPELRREYDDMTCLQGLMLEEEEPVTVSDGLLEALLSKLESKDVETLDVEDNSRNGDIPAPLRAVLPCEIENMKWRFVYPGVRQARLNIGDAGEDVKLLKIKPGRSAPRHTHDGFEATLVLRGAFRDEGKLYVRGDVAIANGRVNHRPRAEGEEDCYCLAVNTGALKITDNLKRVLRDFF